MRWSYSTVWPPRGLPRLLRCILSKHRLRISDGPAYVPAVWPTVGSTRALEFFSKATQVDPKAADSYFNLGMVPAQPSHEAWEVGALPLIPLQCCSLSTSPRIGVGSIFEFESSPWSLKLTRRLRTLTLTSERYLPSPLKRTILIGGFVPGVTEFRQRSVQNIPWNNLSQRQFESAPETCRGEGYPSRPESLLLQPRDGSNSVKYEGFGSPQIQGVA